MQAAIRQRSALLVTEKPESASVAQALGRDPRQQLQEFVSEVWRLSLGRQPATPDLLRMVALLQNGASPVEFLLGVAASPEALQRRSDNDAAQSIYPPGHFYSPIVKPDELANSGFEQRRQVDALLHIDFDYAAMEALARAALARHTGQVDTEPSMAERYYSNNDMFGVGDCLILQSFLRHFRPKQWIEVGSGFSSAALLDTLDQDPALSTKVTFIEPNTERLDRLLRREDADRVTIIRSYVQDVPLEVFAQLGDGDVVFFDTTHVSKTGSDVNHDILQILPRLASGVIIHFHDVFDNFEYPSAWIYDENRSWNELYILRAFLMYNRDFDVIFANDSFAKHRRHVLEEIRPEVLQNPGGGLWLRKT